MPIKLKLKRTRPATAGELTRLLHKEWTKPSTRGQPVIVIEGGKGDTDTRLRVLGQHYRCGHDIRSDISVRT